MSELTVELIKRRNNKPTRFELKGKKILRCPFCADDQIALVQDDWMYWCCCTLCGTEGPVRDSRVNAVSVWQKRPLNN